MAESTDRHLVRKAVQGDRGALSQLLRQHDRRIYNVVFRMVGDREDASELTQEAMLRIVQHIGGFDGQAAFTTWIIRIAMNLSISHLRKRKLRSTASLDATPGSGQFDGQAAPLQQMIEDYREPGPAQRVQQDEMLNHLYTAMDRIEDDLRAILVLRDIQEMEYTQIAQVLAIPIGTVKSRLFRARLSLRRQMYKLYPAQQTQDRLDQPRPSSSDPSQPNTGPGASVDAQSLRPEFPTG